MSNPDRPNGPDSGSSRDTDDADGLDPRVARTRAAVLAAATELVAETGLGGLTVEAVVRRSGVARSTIYRQWDSVEALAADALRALVGGQPDRPLPVAGDLGDELVELLGPLLATALDQRPRIGLLPALLAEADRSLSLPDLRGEVVDVLLTPVERVVARAVGDGRLPDHVDAREAAEHVLGTLVVRRFLVDRPVDEADLHRLARVVEALPGA